MIMHGTDFVDKFHPQGPVREFFFTGHSSCDSGETFSAPPVSNSFWSVNRIVGGHARLRQVRKSTSQCSVSGAAGIKDAVGGQCNAPISWYVLPGTDYSDDATSYGPEAVASSGFSRTTVGWDSVRYFALDNFWSQCALCIAQFITFLGRVLEMLFRK